MRVCLIAPVPPFRGGVAKYCHLLARELEKRHQLMLVSYRRQYPALLYGKKSQVDPELSRDEIGREFSRLSFDLDSANPISWRATARRIAAFRPDLALLPWWVAYFTPMYLYFLAFFGKRGIRVTLVCINVFEHEDSALKKFLTRAVLSRARSLVVHSSQEKEEILHFHPGATVKTHLLPLFEYRRAPAPEQDGRFHLLFFGFVRDYKGLDTLIRALALLDDPAVVLTVAGEFWSDKERYLRLVEELGLSGEVEIADGYLPDAEMSRRFARADLVVLPYRRTRTSGVIATAYGYGRPVLATDIGGFAEVVEEGATGRLVPPDDPEALALGIRWFMENRHIDFAGNIERLAAGRMSWGSLAEVVTS